MHALPRPTKMFSCCSSGTRLRKLRIRSEQRLINDVNKSLHAQNFVPRFLSGRKCNGVREAAGLSIAEQSSE